MSIKSIMFGMSGIISYGILISSFFYFTNRESDRYRDAKELEGILIKEKFVRGTNNSMSSKNPDRYSMVVKMDDGSIKQFLYDGESLTGSENKAMFMDTKYDVGDIVKWKEGFEPESNLEKDSLAQYLMKK